MEFLKEAAEYVEENYSSNNGVVLRLTLHRLGVQIGGSITKKGGLKQLKHIVSWVDVEQGKFNLLKQQIDLVAQKLRNA